MNILLIVIIIAAFVGSILTFFSGFGLGTILVAVFTVFFAPELAIAMTAIVHLFNNVFISYLQKRKSNYPSSIWYSIHFGFFHWSNSVNETRRGLNVSS